ncbi:phage portal protein [Granulicella tundricola]|uniref:Phage portal protein, HK97 family n=1 Tax=Granulicella tundricola (strain ATCC BAA-1859 / DSM 23138 / MP5ACTX9) TaxID=1198114 RepID=E8X0Q4_GRATM|nr:phage portal protein [Granulicella tundricola]ADW69005.1 phage portal protein, HK97 family [Granulicella tundricola MP5ACTX9]
MEVFSSIRALLDTRDKGHPISLELRQQPTLNTPSVPLSGVGFEWAYELGGGDGTVSGEAISNDTAMRIITVYACIRVLSQAIASLPLVLKEKIENGSTDAVASPLYYILGTEPNPEMDKHRFWATIVTGLMLTGNAYCQIVRNNAGQVVELYPLLPTITEPYRLDSGILAFRTQQGQAPGNWKTLPATDVCHFALMCLDGIKGMSPIHQAREGLGLARAAEKAGARLFGNGARPGGLLIAPADITPEQKEQARKSWQANHGGSNQNGTAVLEGDWKYEALSLSPEDSQFIQVRAMQRTEICALYGVPPNMAGDTSRLSNNNHEQTSLSFVTDTLRPILSTLECELNRKLMPKVGRKAGSYFAEFDLSERLRGDFATQMKGYAMGKQWGWYSTNDIRRKLRENTIPDPQADVYLYPVNMANADQLPAQADEENIEQQPVKEPEKEPNAA